MDTNPLYEYSPVKLRKKRCASSGSRFSSRFVCMKLEVKKIYSKGAYRQECVVLKVLEDCEIGRYLISKAGFSDHGKVAVRCKQAYWFPDQKVKKGDFVWLYTRAAGAGEQDFWNSGPKATTYTFFWGLGMEVWDNEWEYIVIVEAAEWIGKPVEEA